MLYMYRYIVLHANVHVHVDYVSVHVHAHIYMYMYMATSLTCMELEGDRTNGVVTIGIMGGASVSSRQGFPDCHTIRDASWPLL